jgi:hypothetical protein
MKKVIELLEDALDVMLHVTQIPESYQEVAYIKDAIAELRAPPRWYTPEQWEQRTGKPWPDNWAVYYRSYPDNEWSLFSFKFAKYQISIRGVITTASIICVTEAGPPPNDWRPWEPEEKKANG